MIEVKVQGMGGTTFHGIYEEQKSTSVTARTIFLLKLSRLSFPSHDTPGKTFNSDWRKISGKRRRGVGPLPMVVHYDFIEANKI